MCRGVPPPSSLCAGFWCHFEPRKINANYGPETLLFGNQRFPYLCFWRPAISSPEPVPWIFARPGIGTYWTPQRPRMVSDIYMIIKKTWRNFSNAKISKYYAFLCCLFFSRPPHFMDHIEKQIHGEAPGRLTMGGCGRTKDGTGLRYSESVFPSHGTYHTTNNNHFIAINS